MQLLYQIIYYPFINRILLSINKLISPFTKFQLPPSGIITLKSPNGSKFRMATNQTSYVTKFLYWKGTQSFEYTTIFEQLIGKVDEFFDIGANTGYYSLLAGTVNKKAHVYSFEPSNGPLHYLRKNIDLNELNQNIKEFNFALSDHEDKLEFYEVLSTKYRYLKHNLGGVGSLKKETNSKRNLTLVSTTTLDGFAEKEGIQKIDLIKIDTEGTENLILLGAQNIISQFKPIIICETLFQRIEKELEDIMRSHGYEFYNHIDQKLHRTETLIRKKDNGVRDCFFVHPEKTHLIQEFILN